MTALERFRARNNPNKKDDEDKPEVSASGTSSSVSSSGRTPLTGAMSRFMDRYYSENGTRFTSWLNDAADIVSNAASKYKNGLSDEKLYDLDDAQRERIKKLIDDAQGVEGYIDWQKNKNAGADSTAASKAVKDLRAALMELEQGTFGQNRYTVNGTEYTRAQLRELAVDPHYKDQRDEAEAILRELDISDKYGSKTVDELNALLEETKAEKSKRAARMKTNPVGTMVFDRSDPEQEIADIQRVLKLKKQESYAAEQESPDFETWAQRGAEIKNPAFDSIRTGGKLDVRNKVAFSQAYDADMDAAMEAGLHPDTLAGAYIENVDKMSDTEIKIYNAILARDGEKAADDYLDAIEDTLNARTGQEIYESAQTLPPVLRQGANAILSAAGGAAGSMSGLEQWFSGEARAIRPTEYAQAQVAENAANPVSRTLYNVAGAVGGMAPGIIAGAAAGPAVGTAVFGAGAGGNMYGEALREGKPQDQALAYGILGGASEAALQYVLGGIKAFKGVVPSKISSALSKAVSKVSSSPIAGRIAGMAAEIGSEGLEEYLQEILNPVFRNLTFGESNEIKLSAPEAWEAAIIGALTAGFMNAPGNTVDLLVGAKSRQDISEFGKLAKNPETLQNLIETAKLAAPEGDPVYKAAEDIALKLEQGKTVSDYTAGQFAAAVGQAVERAQTSEINRRAETVSGLSNDVQIAPLVPLTGAASAVDSREGVNLPLIQNAAPAASQSTGIAQRPLNASVTRSEVPASTDTSPSAQASPPAAGETSRALGAAAAVNGQAVTVERITAKAGQIFAEVSSGPAAGTYSVSLQDISFENPEIGRVYAAAASLDAPGVSAYINNYDGRAPQATYDRAFKLLYYDGMTGKSFATAVKRGGMVDFLDAGKQMAIWTAGTRAKDERTAARKRAATRQEREGAAGKTKPGLRRAFSSRITEEQEAQLAAIDAAAKKTGFSVRAVDDAQGENGYYDPKTGEIVVSVSDPDAALVRVFGHELTHALQDWAAEKYTAYRDFVVGELTGADTAEFDRRVEGVVSAYAQRGFEIDREFAVDEIVADASEMMLRDTAAIRTIAKRDPSLAEKIRDFIAEWVGKIQKAFEDIAAGSWSARYLTENLDAAKQAQRLWDAALVEASRSRNAAVAARREAVNETPKNENAPPPMGDSAVRFSVQNDYDLSEKTAAYTPERVQLLYDKYASGHMDYSQAYVTYMSPDDFLSLSTTNRERIERETTKLDEDKLRGEYQEIFLSFDQDTGEVTGHEGRHRMAALAAEGIERVAVVLKPNGEKGKYERKSLRGLKLTGQEFSHGTAPGRVTVGEALPISKRYRAELEEKFSGAPARIRFSLKEKYTAAELRGKKLTVQRVPPQISPALAEQLKNSNRKEAKIILRELAAKFGVKGSYENADVDMTVEYSNARLDESLNKQRGNYDDLGRLQAVLRYVVKNAVAVEAHADKYEGTRRADNKLKQVYVLLGAFQDGGEIVPVKLEIKEFDLAKRPASLHLAVTLQRISADSALGSWNNNSRGINGTALTTLSLTDLIKKINPRDLDILKYIPNELLTDAQRQAVEADAAPKTDTDADDIFPERILRRSLRDIPAEHINNAMLDELNRRAGIINDLKAQFRLTKGHVLNKNAMRRYAQRILRKYSSGYDVEALTDNLNAVFSFIANAEGDVSYPEVIAMFQDVAKAFLDKTVTVDRTLYDRYADMRSFLHNTSVRLNEAQIADIIRRTDSFQEFRARNFGRVNFTRYDGTGAELDAIWGELSDRWPEMFPADTHELDQATVIADVLAAVQPKYEAKIYQGMTADEIAGSVALELFDGYFGIPEVKTFADKKQAELERVKAHYRQRISEIRQEKNEQTDKKLERIREEVKQQRLAQGENRARRGYITQIEKNSLAMMRWLRKPTDAQHVPEGLRRVVADFMGSLDFTSPTLDRTGTPTQKDAKFQKALNDIRAAFEEIERANTDENAESDFYADVDPDFLPKLKNLIDSAAGKEALIRLDTAELMNLSYVVQQVRRMITKANETLANRLFRRMNELAAASVRQMAERRETKNRGILDYALNFLNIDMLDSFSYFERLGSASESVLESLRDGFDRKTELIAEAEAYMNSLIDKTNKIRLWVTELHTFDTIYGKIKVTSAQLMELYAHSFREQSKGHLFGGGVKFSDAKFKTEIDENGNEVERIIGGQIRSTEPQKLDPQVLANMFEELTEEQIRIADGMRAFMTEHAAEWGNSASMLMYGYRKFTDPDYWPIKSDSDYLNARDPDKQFAVNAVKNTGLTKGTVEGANNPIVIDDIFATFTQHVDEMSSYAGLAAPLADAMRWYNYSLKVKGSYTDSIKQSIGRIMPDVHGRKNTGGQAYFIKLIKDINGASTGDGAAIWTNKILSNVKIASVAANMRVVVQQPASYLRAAALMKGKHLAAALKGVPHTGKLIERMNAHAPIARWKSWGFYEMNTGRSMREIIVKDGGIVTKAQELALAPAGAADTVTWATLWYACELETAEIRPDLERGSEEFYEAAGRRFSKVIDRTQVVDTVFHRSQIMRSRDGLNKLATSFMSEPIKSYNLFLSALSSARNSNTPENRRRVARTAAAIVLSNAAAAALAALFDAMRDDDEEKDENGDPIYENFGNTYLSALGSNLIDNLFPPNMIPYAREVVSIFSGYTPSRMDMDAVTSVKWNVDGWIKYFGGESKKSAFELIQGTATAVSKLTGIPVGNLLREAYSVYNTVVTLSSKNPANMNAAETFAYSMKRFDITKRDSDGSPNAAANEAFYNALAQAEREGDKTTYETLYNALLQNGRKPSGIAIALKNRRVKALREDERIKQAAQYAAGKDFYNRKKIIDAMIAEGNEKADVEKAIDAELKEIYKAAAPDVEEFVDAYRRGNRDEWKPMYDALRLAGWSHDDLIAMTKAE